MKKSLITFLAAAVMVAVATGAWAIGPGGGMGMGMGMCPMASPNVSPEQTQKFTQFQNDTLTLRQKMLQLKTELMTLRAQPAKDWKAITDKQKEMVDVRAEIQKKAEAAGLPFGQCMCGGPGAGCMGKPGMGMGTRGMGMCRMGM